MGMLRKYYQEEVFAAVEIPWASGIDAIAGAGITVGDIVVVNGLNTGKLQVIRADADAVLTSRGLLYVATGTVAVDVEVTCVPWALLEGGRVNAVNPTGAAINTAAAAVGDPVYLSGAAGGWALAPGAFAVQVGEVIVSNATTGAIKFYPQSSFGGGAALAGFSALTLTVNDDAAAATDEDPGLRLFGGDGVVAPNDDLVRSTWRQDTTAEQSWIETERSRAAAAYVRVSSDFGIGRQGDVTASLDASLRFNAGNDAAAARRYTLRHMGQEGIFDVSYDQAGVQTSPVFAIGRDQEATASLDATLRFEGGTDAAVNRTFDVVFLAQENLLEFGAGGVGDLHLLDNVELELGGVSAAAGDIIFVPNGTDVVVSNTGAAELQFHDDLFRIVDDADATRQIVVSAGSITTGNERTLTMADRNVDLDFALQRQITTITTVQLLDLEGTPITIVTAPGANRIAVLSYIIFEANFTAAALGDAAAQGNLLVRYDGAGADTNIGIQEADGLIDAGADRVAILWLGTGAGTTSNVQAAATNLVNTEIELLNDGGTFTDPGAADTTLVVHAFYYTVPAPV